MTSPLRTILTLSPIDICNLFTSPRLCNVTFSTVTPETVTGATLATGVIVPVLPTCQSTFKRTVIASSGGNFQAKAHRGWWAVIPSKSLLESKSNFITTPSISQAASFLLLVHSSVIETAFWTIKSLLSADITVLPAISIPILVNQ